MLKESSIYGGPAILPAGKKQCYEAGKAFRDRYLDPNTCNTTSTTSVSTCLTPPGGGAKYGLVNSDTYSNYVLLANSSALHRTVNSATSFFLGVFGGDTLTPATLAQAPYLAVPMVPVFSVSEEQDVAIRGYTKCPAYDRRLARWFASDEFKQKEAETAAVRAKVAELAPGLNTSLSQFWNVFDAFNVWRTYQVGEQMPEVPEELYKEIVGIATWLETGKMRSSLARNLLGGVLLADVVGRVEAAAKAVVDGFPATYYRFLAISGHYNTQLGVLAALGADQAAGSAQVPWFTSKIPSPAAVLIFELHRFPAAPQGQGPDALAVRLVLQDGPAGAYQVVPLPCSSSSAVAGEEGFCQLDRFLAMAGAQALSPQEWCRACENTGVLVCKVK